ncbi:nucleotide-binding protein, partial [Candidatus Nitrosopelagicus sp.]|nr:nucleotide-binding protein [Candidatus Nitrosopelagicus sp.]
MVFRVLDATAFYAGMPFTSNDSFMTTSAVYDEIQHIKMKQGAIEMLQQTNRLQIRDPDKKFINIVKDTAYKTGDNTTISKQDISII